MRPIIIINIHDWHIQEFPKTNKENIIKLRKSSGKLGEGKTGKKDPGQTKRQEKKETGKTTIHKDSGFTSRQLIQQVDSLKRLLSMRPKDSKMPRGNSVWAPDKKGKKVSKMGRVELPRPVQLSQLPGQHGATTLHKLVSKALRRTAIPRPRRKK